MATRLEVFAPKWIDYYPPSDCWDFGISAILAGALPAVFATDASIAAGAALAPTLGASLIGGALPGAAIGAGTSAISGRDPLLGALTGGLTGGAIGAAGPVAEGLGISPTIAKTIAGGTAGLVGSEVTGQDPLFGALGGAGSGLISGALSTGSTAAPVAEGAPAGTTGGGLTVPSAAPSSAAPLSSDLTAGADILSGDFSGGGPDLGITGGTSLATIGGSLGTATGNVASGGGSGMAGEILPGYSGSGMSSIYDPLEAAANPLTYGATNPADIAGGGAGNWLTNTLGTTGGEGIGSRILQYLGDNPMLALGGGLLGTTLLMNQGDVPGSKPLSENAALLTRYGTEALKSLQTGQVPSGAQSLLDQSRASMNARTRSTYANLGLSGSTMEAQALAQNDAQVEASKWKIIEGLVGQGTTALGSASTTYNNLMLQEIAKDQATQNALARFAAALAGGSMVSQKAA